GRACHEVIALHGQFGQEVSVLGIRFDKLVRGVILVAFFDRAVLGVVVHADYAVALVQEILHEVPCNESRGAGYEYRHRIPSMRQGVAPLGIPRSSTHRSTPCLAESVIDDTPGAEYPRTVRRTPSSPAVAGLAWGP